MNRIPAIGVLDLGASGGRVFAATLTDNRLHLRSIYRFAHAPQRYWQATGGSVESRVCWDFARIYAGMLEGLRLISLCDDLDLVSFGVDTWGSDGAWINASGDMLGLVGTGRDRRWQTAREEIGRQISEEELFLLTGTRSEPFCVLNQLYWYTNHQPKLVQAASTYMPLNSLLHYFLCGERAAEYTWMSTTQLVRPGRHGYHESVFGRLRLPLDKMPPLVQPGTPIGRCHDELAASLGLPTFRVIVPATHDTASAYAAAPVKPGTRPIVISCGTWCLVGMGRPDPLISTDVYHAGLTNIGGCEEVYLHAVIMGTWPAQELQRLWSRQDRAELSWDDIGRLAEAGPALTSILDIDNPAFYAPQDMEHAIVQFCRQTGQSPPLGRAAMARAVHEGLALKTAMLCQSMQTVAGCRADEIVMVGGGTRNRLLCQWLADSTGLPVRLGSSEATALGNTFVQARALGWITSLAEGRALLDRDGAETVYYPHVNDGNAGWERAKEKVRNWERQGRYT